MRTRNNTNTMALIAIIVAVLLGVGVDAIRANRDIHAACAWADREADRMDAEDHRNAIGYRTPTPGGNTRCR